MALPRNASKISLLLMNTMPQNIHIRLKHTRIGCASGFWGDSPSAVTQLVEHGKIDFIMMDYLSEVTMSLLTAARAAKPHLGYAPDFVSHTIGPQLKSIKNQGIKIISNAGGINAKGCAEALKAACEKSGVSMKIAVVTGDDLMPQKTEFIGVKDPWTNQSLPKTVHSMNAYLGAGPIARCLDEGADIVVTGRCADSSLALGPIVHALKWKWNDFDKLASGSLAGHLIECGTQVTGGIFTDWQDSDDWQNSGYPIAEVNDDGSMLITKNEPTGGVINKGTVSEQMLYELGDPRAYVLPDVVCDFTQVQLEECPEGVRVTGAIGKPPTDSYKVSATYLDGFKSTAVAVIGGPKSVQKGRKTAQALIQRCSRLFKERNLPDFLRTNIQIIGAEDMYGPHANSDLSPRDAAIWMSVHHSDKKALEMFAMEIASSATGMSPGLSVMVGGRPKATPLLRLHSFLVPKGKIKISTQLDEEDEKSFLEPSKSESVPYDTYENSDKSVSSQQNLIQGSHRYRLEDLAYTRSGDKGDSCNIGVIARKASFLPYLKKALTCETVAAYFKHLLPEGPNPDQYVKRYEIEGISALNFVLRNSLGGGGIASLRTDPQGKAYGQMLLDFTIDDMPPLEDL